MLRTLDRSVHSIEISGTVRVGRAKTEHGVLIWQCLPMYRWVSKEFASTIIIYPRKNIHCARCITILLSSLHIWPEVVFTETSRPASPELSPVCTEAKPSRTYAKMSCMLGYKVVCTGTGQLYLAGESRLTGNCAALCDTGISHQNLLAAHQNTHSYHIRLTLPGPYLPFKVSPSTSAIW